MPDGGPIKIGYAEDVEQRLKSFSSKGEIIYEYHQAIILQA